MQDSQKCTFDVDGLADYIDLNSFRFSLVAYTTDKIAIATSRYLSILGGTTYQREKDNDTIQTVVEFGEVSGRPTAIQWLTHDFLCVGFESGSFACFNDFGETIAEHTVYHSPVIALRVTVAEDGADSILWALHEDGYFISVSVKYLFTDNYKKAIVKYKLNTLTPTLQFNDFIFLGNVSYAALLDAGSSDTRFGTCILAGGQDPSISLYNISKQAKNMRDKLASTLTKSVSNALTSFFGGAEKTPEEASTSAVYHFADPKRIVLRLSIDPSLQLIATADSLGRVMLYDKRLFAVIRLWKGVREARLAWTEGTQNEKRTLCLVIYAPQTGLLSLYAMKHGPCLRSIPVGPQCHIFTIYEMTHESSCQCLLLRQNNSNQLVTTELLPFGYSDEDIDLSSESNFAFTTPRKDDLQDISKLQRIIDRILTAKSVYDAEQRLWLNLCHVHDLQFVERCLPSIDTYEREYYYKNRDGRGFSLVFQRNLCRLFNPENSSEGIKMRNRLLKAYELLVDMNHQTSMNVLESSPPPGTEKNKWFKQHDIRAEAICWSARLLAQHSDNIPLPHSPVPLKHHDSFVSDSGGHGRLTTRTPSPLRNDSLSSSNASNDMQISTSSPRSPPPPLSPKKSGIVKPNSSMYRTTSFMQSSVVLPFAVFTSFFVTSDTLQFRATEILSEIQILRRETNKSDAGALAPLSTLYELLQFLFLPLLGDAFALNSFIRILDHMNIATGYNVMLILPLIIVFMEKQNFSIIFNTQVNKSLSSSSIQRWLRDTILEFQGYITPSPSENLFADMDATAIQLLQEIMNSRRIEGDTVTPPSFDESVKYILRPSWVYLRTSVSLECAMIVAAQVIEVLEAINDQLERRTYGATTLLHCKMAWYTLFRQLRVTLLLSSRVGGGLSIDKLGGGDISIYNLLAADTLCFALEPEQAVEHELRCHEVYARRTKLEKQDSSALLAWGQLADQRWKELLAVAEAEDTPEVEKKLVSPRKKKIRRRRPLLLFFPSHNHAHLLGVYRSLILAERWLNRPRKVEFLALCSGHLLPLPETLRAAASNEICKVAILPLLLAYLELEEGVVHRERSNEYVHEMLQIMANSELVEKFVQASVDILLYAARLHHVVNNDAFHMATAAVDVYSDESGPEIWPPLHDSRILAMVQASSGGSEEDAKWTICLLYVLQMRAQYGLRGVKPSELFGKDFLKTGRRRKEIPITSDILSHAKTPVDAPSYIHGLQAGTGLDDIRKEFLLQCFRRIGAQSTQTVYHIAEVWGFSLQQIRLLHLLILLELNLDEQVEELISQIDSIPHVIDLVIQGVRSRLGHTVSLIDRIPACGPLLASLDPDASNWARDAVTTPDSVAVANVMKGKSPLLPYDIKSSRHLVIRIQALLLTIPSADRDDTWRIRKSRSDSLLAVCTSFASAITHNSLKDTGIHIQL